MPQATNRTFFPFLFAVYPILYIAASNPGQANAGSILFASVVVLLVSLVLFSGFYFGFKDRAPAAGAVLAVEVLFFAYGPVHSLLERWNLDYLAGRVGPLHVLNKLLNHCHPVLSIIWIALAVNLLRKLSRSKKQTLAKFISPLNFMSALLVVMVIIQLVSTSTAKPKKAMTLSPATTSGLAQSRLGYNPDIYYIILDGYARADVLKDRYHFDNSPFVESLKKRGFQTSSQSFANYYWTFLSMGSSLNYDYLQNFMADAMQAAGKIRAPVYEAIRNNGAARFLRERGYRFVHFQSTWGATFHNPHADEQIRCQQGLFSDEFHRVLAEASWLKVLTSKASVDLAKCHLANLASLKEMGGKPGPKFVFFHLVPPHHPYLFNRDGNILRDANLSNQFEFQKRLWEKKDMYVDQLLFVNQKITEAVDSILKQSKSPPIILVYSDHGPNLIDNIDQQHVHHVRFANLAMHLLPKAPADLIPNRASPVNLFRRIFNYYFDAGLPILPDHHYISGHRTPYHFNEFRPLKAF